MAQQINLFDPGLQRQRDWFALTNLVLAAAALTALVAVAGSLAQDRVAPLQALVAANGSQLEAMRDQLALLGQRVAGNRPDPRLESELTTLRQLADGRGEVLRVLRQRIEAPARPFAEFLRGLARQSVDGLWLTAFAYDADGGGMEIRGRTVDPALLPEYIRRLNRESAFQGHAFAALRLAAGKAVQADGKPAAAAPAPFHDFVLVPARDESAGQAAPAGNPG